MTALDAALEALRDALEGVDNPVAAARALQRIAARHRLQYKGQPDAFRWEAEKLLRPFFEPEIQPFADVEGAANKACKATVWLALDAAWAERANRG